jgi:hypothetical protein
MLSWRSTRVICAIPLSFTSISLISSSRQATRWQPSRLCDNRRENRFVPHILSSASVFDLCVGVAPYPTNLVHILSIYLSIYLFYYWWGGTKSQGTAATSGLLYKPQMIDEDDCGAIYLYIYLSVRLSIHPSIYLCHVGFCGGQSGAGVGFLRVLRFPLQIFIPPIAPKIIIIYHRGLYNRPNWPQYQGLIDT